VNARVYVILIPFLFVLSSLCLVVL